MRNTSFFLLFFWKLENKNYFNCLLGGGKFGVFFGGFFLDGVGLGEFSLILLMDFLGFEVSK
jgi:hypothetical protein